MVLRSSTKESRAEDRARSQDGGAGDTAGLGHQPMRTCLGCMRRDLQAAMIRVAVVDGRVRPDDTHRSPGRGGYLHRAAECLLRFERSRVKEFRSLRRKIGAGERNEITESVRSRLASSAQLE